MISSKSENCVYPSYTSKSLQKILCILNIMQQYSTVTNCYKLGRKICTWPY